MALVAKIKKPGSVSRPSLPHTRGVQAVRTIRADGPFGYRYRLADPALQASIQKKGILMPIVVSDDPRPVVIAGHKRLYAARVLRMKEVSVFVAAGVKPKDAFGLNLISNWRGACSEIDRAQALGRARALGFTEPELLSEVMPLLGLSEDKATLEIYLKLDRAPVPLKDLIEDGPWPLRGAVLLLKFTEKDQDYFARKIGSQVKLSSSQLLQAGEWLLDLLRGKGKTLNEFCREQKLLEGLAVPGMDPRAKADKFFARLKRLRSPHYAAYRDQFDATSQGILGDVKGLRLEPVQGFEEPGFELQARVKTPEELDLLLRRLEEKRTALNSLFEIML